MNPPRGAVYPESISCNMPSNDDPETFERDKQNERFSILLEIRRAFKEDDNGEVAYDDFIWANTMIWNEVAGFVIRQIAGRGEIAQKNLNSFISSCVVSILSSIDDFDPNRGYKLTTFLTPYVNNGISEEFKDILNTGTTYFNQNIRKVKKALNDFLLIGVQSPTVWELAEVTGLSPSQVEAVIDKIAISEATSLEADEELQNIESDFPNPLQAVIEAEGTEVLIKSLSRLSPFERQVLYLRYDFANETERGERSINYIASQLNKRPDEINAVLVKCHRILRNNSSLKNFYGNEHIPKKEEPISRSSITEAFFDEGIEELERRLIECSITDEDPISTILKDKKGGMKPIIWD